MNVTKKTTDNQCIRYSISGSLTGTEKSMIRLFEFISTELDKSVKNIILDIESVTYFDSMSIGLIVGLLLKCKEKEIGFKFENVPDHIRKTLDSTNLKKAYPELY
jgi:anti-anti-sigma factor